MNEKNEHPLTWDETERIWEEARRAFPTCWSNISQATREGALVALRAAFDAGREHERTHTDDGWEPLGDGKLRVGDEARYVYGGITRSGVVASIDADGYPWTTGGAFIGSIRFGTWSVRRAPVTWHRLPTEHPAHITDVTGEDGDTCAYMAVTCNGFWRGVDQDGMSRICTPCDIAACTLDGTRLTRDGEFEDGTPRFREEAGE